MTKLEHFIIKHGDNSFFVYILIGIAPVFLYDTEFNIPFIWAFKHCTIPIVILCYLIAYSYMPEWKANTGQIKRVVMPLLVSALLILFTGGYALGINALVGSQKEIIISGEILDMSIAGGRTKSYIAKVADKHSGEIKELGISPKEFKSYRIGDAYQQLWLEGSLGFLYQTK